MKTKYPDSYLTKKMKLKVKYIESELEFAMKNSIETKNGKSYVIKDLDFMIKQVSGWKKLTEDFVETYVIFDTYLDDIIEAILKLRNGWNLNSVLRRIRGLCATYNIETEKK